MTTLKPTAKQLRAIEEVLDSEHASVSAAAKAVWDAVADEVLDRSRFAVAAQLVGTRERGTIPPNDPESVKLALAYFGTAGDAQKAAESLILQPATGDRWLAWVIPVAGMTAADLTKKRREEIAAAEAKREDKVRETFRASIAKRREQMEALAETYAEEERRAA